MNKQTKASDAVRTDAAFNRVLAAEAQAREEVEACRQEAAALRAAAEDAARSIADRTDRRMRLTHELTDAALARALRRLLGPPDAPNIMETPVARSAHLMDNPATQPPINDLDDLAPPPGLNQAIATLIHEILAAPRGSDR